MELGEISKAEVVRGYDILRQNISNKMKQPGPDIVMVTYTEDYLVRWDLDMHNDGRPVRHEMIINKSRDIYSGRRPGFFRGNVQESIGGSCGFPMEDKDTVGGATVVRDIAASGSRDGS